MLEGSTHRASQGWCAAAPTITQLGPLEEGGSEVEVASVLPSRSEINPMAFLKKKKKEDRMCNPSDVAEIPSDHLSS